MKKLFVLISLIAVAVIACVSFSVSADDGTVVIDNVVYELTTQKYGKYDYGEHYAVTDFFYEESLADTTTKINIVDEIGGIEVKVIHTNLPETGGDSEPSPEYDYSFPIVKNIVIPGTVKYIGYYSFSFFPNVEKLYLPAELEGIGTGAFCLMKSLRSITIPQGVTYISDRTFYGCESLKKVKIAGNILGIGEFAFGNCKNLTSLNFPNSIKEFGEGAFYNTALKKIIIPENVKLHTDGGGITQGCSKLEKIVFEDTSSDKAKYLELMCLDRTPAVKGLYIKTIPTESLLFGKSDLDNLPNLEKIYFAGSEEKWNVLTSDTMRKELELRGIEVEFYYRHSHSFKQSGKATCKNGGTYTYTCECGDSYKQSVSKAQVKHKYGAWKVTKKATYTATGTKQRTCSVCSKTEKKTYYMLKLGVVSEIRCESFLDKITLSWDASRGATGYRVYRREYKDGRLGEYVKLASIKGKTTYTIKNLEKGTEYYFAVQPYNKDSKGNVVFSEKTIVVTQTLATAPKNLVGVSEEAGNVNLTWESSGNSVTYIVKVSDSKEDAAMGKYYVSYHAGIEETDIITHLLSGHTYYFWVSIDDFSSRNFDTVDGIKTSNIVEVTVK
ncbi:MAG: leucine-rich repeat protein [Clostridia bacterium]|nr:leucine-rich repeat protein [Clostridia bacterium]